jgi:hypothetical protein
MTTRTLSLPVAAGQKFSIALSVFVAAIVVAGFWPTYFGPLLAGIADKPWFIHFHAMVYSGWVLVFMTQVFLAATGRLVLHRKYGEIAIYYGYAIIAVGVFTAFAMFASRVQAGNNAEGQARLLAPLTDMMVFPVFFLLAVRYRNSPELHKRLMLVAMTALLVAAALRMRFLGELLPLNARTLIWLSPILIAMAYDGIAKRIVHPVYIVGLAALYVLSLRRFLTGTDAWLAISGWLANLFA